MVVSNTVLCVYHECIHTCGYENKLIDEHFNPGLTGHRTCLPVSLGSTHDTLSMSPGWNLESMSQVDPVIAKYILIRECS